MCRGKRYQTSSGLENNRFDDIEFLNIDAAEGPTVPRPLHFLQTPIVHFNLHIPSSPADSAEIRNNFYRNFEHANGDFFMREGFFSPTYLSQPLEGSSQSLTHEYIKLTAEYTISLEEETAESTPLFTPQIVAKRKFDSYNIAVEHDPCRDYLPKVVAKMARRGAHVSKSD
uniref:Uncharacterized protein n=1 Tax=Corethron hystrix TaxID=216773 RepID=A0A7S1BF95_9STRA|mmetsp:Transcript_24621/g.56407  ORF Transcript_24621/g.56407 Transcript_24621/m.56407 type:complete len:171 (+) Transcript_24621:222-734(+)